MKKDGIQIGKDIPSKLVSESEEFHITQDGRYLYPTHEFYQEEEGVNLRELFRITLSRKWLIFAVTAIVTMIAVVTVVLIDPWYSASTVVEISKQNSMVLKSGEMRLNEDSDPQYIVTVNTNKLALESPELFEAVIGELKLEQNEKVLSSINRHSLFSFGSSKERLNRIQVAKDSYQDDLARDLRLKPFIEYIQENTSVSQIKDARALKITVMNEDSILAAKIANGIAEVFIKTRFRQQTERFRDSANRLERSTSERKASVRDAEETLARYVRENQIYVTDVIEEAKSPTLTISKLTESQDQYLKARAAKMELRSLFNQVDKGRIKEMSEVFSDPKINELQKQLGVARPILSELKVKFGPKNPKIIEVRNQIAVLETQLKKSEKELEKKIRADYERAMNDERAAKNALEFAKSDARNENQKAVRFNILKQDVKTARDLYDESLQKTSQANVQIAHQNSNIRVIQKAQIPDKPDGPKRKLIVIAAFLFSLASVIALVHLLESLDETIKTAGDVERYLGYPVLGVIPLVESLLRVREKKHIQATDLWEDEGHSGLLNEESRKLVVQSAFHEVPIVSEPYLSLRTAILFSSNNRPPKTILFSSALAREGKTETAVNMAFSLTKLGAKVLIIDCDLRKSTVHTVLGMSLDEGLTDYLANSEFKFEDLIRTTSTSNLSVLSGGHKVSNPTELLSSNKMGEMIKDLYDAYDYIILDSPPITSFTDSRIISTIVDGTVLVVRSGVPTRQTLQRVSVSLSGVNSRVLGVVLNCVDLRKNEYSFYSGYEC